MANKNHSITNSRVYSDAIKEIKSDVEKLSVNGLRRMSVRLPKALVLRLNKRFDKEVALEEVKRNVAMALNDYCLIGRWSEGVDETGAYIQFYLEPEKVKDEV